ncbi:MAG: hypothetical protein ABFC91_05850, partial [Methanobacteriaceae archaeon]
WIILKNKPAQLVFYSVIINSLTLPLAQYVYLNFLENLMLMEIQVVLVETFLLYLLLRVKLRQAIYLSVVANLVSTLVGLVVVSLW